jgi:hypothetical protein
VPDRSDLRRRVGGGGRWRGLPLRLPHRSRTPPRHGRYRPLLDPLRRAHAPGFRRPQVPPPGDVRSLFLPGLVPRRLSALSAGSGRARLPVRRHLAPPSPRRREAGRSRASTHATRGAGTPDFLWSQAGGEKPALLVRKRQEAQTLLRGPWRSEVLPRQTGTAAIRVSVSSWQRLTRAGSSTRLTRSSGSSPRQ